MGKTTRPETSTWGRGNHRLEVILTDLLQNVPERRRTRASVSHKRGEGGRNRPRLQPRKGGKLTSCSTSGCAPRGQPGRKKGCRIDSGGWGKKRGDSVGARTVSGKRQAPGDREDCLPACFAMHVSNKTSYEKRGGGSKKDRKTRGRDRGKGGGRLRVGSLVPWTREGSKHASTLSVKTTSDD